MEKLVVPIEESCNDCAEQTRCEKATHFENYTLNGCSQFKPKKILPILVEQMESLTKEQKEFAEKIFTIIENQLNRYSHVHKYAEDAYRVTDEYADGTPCEMCSVWDVISLHKNGWDDYETMSELSDNIGYINKSMILKEIESDIQDIKRGFLKYGRY